MCDAYYIYLIIDKSVMQYMAWASFEQPIMAQVLRPQMKT